MGILNIATSGLLAYQNALATAGHNIANATKDGYSRQRVELETRLADLQGGNYYGQGVQVSAVERIQSEFVDVQLRDSMSDAASGQVRADYAERIDGLLGDIDTGLAPAIQDFFDAANDVASDPTSSTARTVFLSQAESMINRFNDLSARIEEQRKLVNEQIKLNIDEVNELANSLKDINARIVASYGASGGGGGAPNDLLDERGRLLGELAQHIDIRTLEQSDHTVSVFIGNGQPLVLGNLANELTAANTLGDVRNIGVGFKNANGAADDITKFMTGGELGGLLEIRKEVLDSAQNGIGQIAAVLSVTMNQQNNLGLDYNGDIGDDIFTVPSLYFSAVPGNTATGSLDVQLNENAINDLTAADYSLRYDGTNYQLRRLDTNELVRTIAFGATADVDGLTIDTSSITAVNNNDQWLIQPTRFAAERIDTVMVDPEKIAVAAGALADPNNTGDARMIDLRSMSPTSPNTSVPAGVVFNGTNFVAYSPEYGPNTGAATVEGFRITDPTAPIDGTISYANGEFTVEFVADPIPLDPSGITTINANGWEIKIRGTPGNGDTFDVTSNTTIGSQPDLTTVQRIDDGSTLLLWELDIFGTPKAGDVFSVELRKGREGDNRNMLAMASLADERIVENSETFAGSYNDTLGLVGTRTSQMQVARDSSKALLEQAQANRDAISGVNLDEEAANLIKFQKAYQASAQVISIGSQMFDSLFAALR